MLRALKSITSQYSLINLNVAGAQSSVNFYSDTYAFGKFIEINAGRLWKFLQRYKELQ